jgi:2-oxoglutarate dehydrogenase E1 component
MSDSVDQLGSHNLAFVEALYAEYLRDPQSVEPAWREYFAALPAGNGAAPRIGPTFRPASLFNPPGPPVAAAVAGTPEMVVLQERVDRMVRAYRVRGHLVAQVDPLGLPRREPTELTPQFYGFTEEDFDRPFSTYQIEGADVRTLRSIYEALRNTYCRLIGAQFMHIDDPTSREWLQERMEESQNRAVLPRDVQVRILKRLSDAVIFEEFVQKKYLGAKSFSLEGGESLIPLLDLAIEHAGEQGTDEIVLAMAHRGRLNVLANIMGKSPQEIFREFEDVDSQFHQGLIDVKYHLGYSSDWTTATGRSVHLSLCFNPSHLEFVNPVALGRVRAKQDRAGDSRREQVLPILIHGDAAFAGEGVVQETFNLSDLDAYTTGGALHIVVNNQIGFTTGPAQGRSSTYATDVAKMLQVPIFHVNGEEPEAVAQVVRLALDFRLTFKRDVVIDMYCYRRRGHNEGDEPAFTQPLLYKAIEQRKGVREGYLEHLLTLGGITREEADQIAAERREVLEQGLSAARSPQFVPKSDGFRALWSRYAGGPESAAADVETGVDRARLADLLERMVRLPEGFRPHPKIERFLEARREMATGAAPLDWAAGESLAFASLAAAGVRVRLTGQDVERGTFSQRHAVLHDVQTDRLYVALKHLAEDQGPVSIYNSPLSETAVLGFEYGYSLDYPDGLVMWEAQFGDFVNAAQVIIDQFIASAEDKWKRASGVVLLLPHGFEGMGPEHSSARLERFLAQGARDNLQVVYPTTPAQYFHALRRQVVRPWRKPLVVMTPKSLLRHPRAVSSLEDCARGTFRRVLPDPRGDAPPARLVLLCTGKVYYDLVKEREDRGRDDVAIVRLEQLYPLAGDALVQALAAYPQGTPLRWVQEEPENMGAWRFVSFHFGDRLAARHPFSGVTRPAAASPATGSSSSHKLEQKALLNAAFGEV